jgi:prepilin-type N-terminal cleavage/methylation domain-containing protein
MPKIELHKRLRRPDAAPSGPAPLLRRLRAEGGFTLIELLIATVILLIASAPITSVLLTGSHIAAADLERSGAEKLAASKIQLIQAMPYDNIGFVGGNPSGTLTTTETTPPLFTPTTLNGHSISISYDFSYVNDHGAKTTTYADYKQATVTITDTGTNTTLATMTANIAALNGDLDGGSEFVDIRRNVVDMATGTPALSGVTLNLATGPSAPRSDTTNSAGSVIFPELTANTGNTNFYNVTASLAGYSTYPGDLPYTGTGNPAISLEHVNHQTGADDLQTIHMYQNGINATVNVYKSNGTVLWPTASTVYMGAAGSSIVTQGIAGNAVTTASPSISTATFGSLMLGNSYLVSGSGSTVNVFPDNYEFSAESGSTSAMTYATPQASVTVPSNYPTSLTQTVNLVMGASPCPTNTTVTVTVKRGTTAVQDAHVEISSTATGQSTAPSVYVWGDTSSSGTVSLIVPRNPSTSYSYTIRATDARGSTYTATNQSFTSSSGTATLTITP